MIRAALAGFSAGVSAVCGALCAALLIQHAEDQRRDRDRTAPSWRSDGWARARDTR